MGRRERVKRVQRNGVMDSDQQNSGPMDMCRISQTRKKKRKKRVSRVNNQQRALNVSW